MGGHVRLEMLAKDENSGRTGCPSVYIDENGWAVIQARDRARDQAGPGYPAVRRDQDPDLTEGPGSRRQSPEEASQA